MKYKFIKIICFIYLFIFLIISKMYILKTINNKLKNKKKFNMFNYIFFKCTIHLALFLM